MLSESDRQAAAQLLRTGQSHLMADEFATLAHLLLLHQVLDGVGILERNVRPSDRQLLHGLAFLLGMKPTDGGAPEYTQNGWYENSFARIDGHWKITRLLHTYQWITGNGGLFDFSDPKLIEVMGQVFAPENRVTRS